MTNVLLNAIPIVFHKARSNHEQNYTYLIIKYNIIGYVGFVGFPTYYIIWKYIFEQPYENIYLRLIGSFFMLFNNKEQ